MIVKEYDYVKGNNAISPHRKSNEKDKKKYEELKRSKRDRNKRKLEEQKGVRKAAVQIACVIFFVGMVTISRDVKVYNMQKEVGNIDSQIKNLNDENEALRVELLKVGTLDNIKTQAEQRLGMFVPTKDNRIQIEIPKGYLEDKDKKKTEDKTNQETLFSKLMDALK
ncbi:MULTISPECIES: cell division protein FtsL [Clostridium]|uniref:Cell division protein FtsL n=1 Tax=Clostridium cibarium TaxID=2762247 RepID=A0ABR8PPH6_9CLOT|nr:MULTISPECIES: cell division protein FtsL [Clostridium]MBD7910067.1 cell division protein FtsL [Clostridium cibarium]